uniref:Uncharacterized protein n=1 Tax=Meloidogyne incognita TaxID=6306 RepID=A0A914LNX0_MELIC
MCFLCSSNKNLSSVIDTLHRLPRTDQSHAIPAEFLNLNFNITEEKISELSFFHHSQQHKIPSKNIKRTGIGENGSPVILNGEQKIKADKLKKEWFMNVVAR